MAFPYVSFRYSLVEVHTVVETMLSKLSSFKRASRSLAKTGFTLSTYSLIWCPEGGFWVTCLSFGNLGDTCF